MAFSSVSHNYKRALIDHKRAMYNPFLFLSRFLDVSVPDEDSMYYLTCARPQPSLSCAANDKIGEISYSSQGSLWR